MTDLLKNIQPRIHYFGDLSLKNWSASEYFGIFMVLEVEIEEFCRSFDTNMKTIFPKTKINLVVLMRQCCFLC